METDLEGERHGGITITADVNSEGKGKGVMMVGGLPTVLAQRLLLTGQAGQTPGP